MSESKEEMKRGIATDDELGLQTEEEYLNSPKYKTDLLRIALRKIEVKIHMKTLMGGYPDVIVVSKEAFDNFIPEIQYFLKSEYGDKMVIKDRMFNPIIRYIYFDDNMKFDQTGDPSVEIPELNVSVDFEKELKDYIYGVEARREYFIDDLESKVILKAIELNKTNDEK